MSILAIGATCKPDRESTKVGGGTQPGFICERCASIGYGDKPIATRNVGGGICAIRWRGKLYWIVGTKQQLAVACLWDAAKAGSPFVAIKGFDAIFKKSNEGVIGELIVQGKSRGGPAGSVCLGCVAV